MNDVWQMIDTARQYTAECHRLAAGSQGSLHYAWLCVLADSASEALAAAVMAARLNEEREALAAAQVVQFMLYIAEAVATTPPPPPPPPGGVLVM